MMRSQTKRLMSTAATLILTVACGGQLAQTKQSSATFNNPWDEVPIKTTCTVVGTEKPIEMEVFRHPSDTGSLALSIKDMPMTCAETLHMRAKWSDESTRHLDLDILGEHYQFCRCSFDIESFTLSVPSEARTRLDDYTLIIGRNDVEPSLLHTAKIGDILPPANSSLR